MTVCGSKHLWLCRMPASVHAGHSASAGLPFVAAHLSAAGGRGTQARHSVWPQLGIVTGSWWTYAAAVSVSYDLRAAFEGASEGR